MFIVLTYSRCFILAYIVTSARIFKASVSLALLVGEEVFFQRLCGSRKQNKRKLQFAVVIF